MTSKEPDVVKVPILGSESIIVGFHLTEYLIRDVLTNISASNYVLITDSNLASIYLDKYVQVFKSVSDELFISKGLQAPRLFTRALPPGEMTKSRKIKADIEDWLLSNAVTRDTCFLAMGGGVIGDLIGFVAATFMRGVPFVQIPTTLLAMVDSSIGGKTAIDVPAGKNLIGAFWQPKRIFIDIDFLRTLPEREFSNGMAELIKTAAISNEDDFCKLENGVEAIRDAVLNSNSSDIANQGQTLETRTPQQSLLMDVILASVRFKAFVVTNDEREGGLRGLLNFGHSIGHGIEAIVSPMMLHGECVSIGCIKEAELARNLGHLNQVAVGRLARCFVSYGLPISLDDKKVKERIGNLHCHVDDIMEIMKVDKKNQGDKKRIVMLSAIGKTLEPRASVIADADIHKVLAPEQLVLPVTESATGPKKEVTLTTPGSKSISNRALLIAALGKGTVRIKNLLHSDDTQYMLAALKGLNAAEFEWEDNGETLVVHGGGGKLVVPDKELYVGNAGTASRFLTSVLTMIPTNEGAKNTAAVLTGNARMKQRPIAPLLDALKANDAQITSLEKDGFLPIAVTPNGGFKGGRIELAASISSQYVSSILLCAPYAKEPVELVLVGGQVISQPYIDMTIAMMESFGATVERLPENTYRIKQAIYQNPDTYLVESDASSATYPLAIAAITGTTCTVSSIGSNSLQGDAGFAVNVLRPMGCTVIQTETATTVTGPPIGQLRPLPSIDMETMTDAFLTATVLAAVTSSDGKTENITRITGIANQRVKECNRIAAMVHELTKFGVQASELPDGIQIHGKPIKDLKAPKEGVHTYDDHRIAMSFSVFSTVVPHGTIITDKKCVEKTWPTWWDDLERKLGVRLNGIDLGARLANKTTLGRNKPTSKTDQSQSLVIVGMRGAGKTTLGQYAAKALGFNFIDVDQHFEQTLNTTITEFINTWGWDQFRLKETEILKQLLDSSYARQHVISCGGGIIETAESREVLKKHHANGGKVLHLVRDLAQVVNYLNRDQTRPMFGEDMMTVWRRRRQWYKEVCNYEFVAYAASLTDRGFVDPPEWEAIKKDLKRFLWFIYGRNTNHVDISPNIESPTTFVSLTSKNLATCADTLKEVCEGADAVELRVDLLQKPDDKEELSPVEYVGEQLALLRRAVSIPVIFTVRSKGQAGAFPNDDEEGMFELLRWGQRWGCEYIDVEMCWSTNKIESLVASKGQSRIISSWHDLQKITPWDSAAIEAKYELGAKYGDIVKLVGVAETMQDNFKLEAFRATKQDKNLIAINMGVAGQLSRILNDCLTPVTHPALPKKAAPGQLSLAEINQARHLLGILPAKSFWLIGTPIQHSMSPTLHNTGFQTLGLPYTYGLLECHMVEYAEEAILNDPHFGGASVTIPHKVSIMKYLDQVSEDAKMIGAVNTIYVRQTTVNGEKKRLLLGENTDYLGMKHRIQALMMDPDHPPQQGLVIGAGGTARAALYTMQQMGIQKIYLWNRTVSKAYDLQQAFKGKIEIEVIESLETKIGPGVIISTVPADSSIELPEHLYGGIKGIICDMAYKPRRTKLLLQAEQKGWSCVEGIEILIAQGIAQFEIWTGKRAPVDRIEDQVLRKYSL
ncbi:Pentafunctional AroM protein [Rhizopus microsporus var. microsporus]|uniref:Pentafunctional AROM polypeptide n=2 Tax=Rhizopus microsporus TaxID=58291 RepID=A0A2G4SRM4_RHIZD|nr:Shikimate dehydrogenase [Rhizopus microsporus ATCC 52813]ORE06034.1 Pentafunctional AroM protein [Rhizopus microsporus var. microsporus]PHZ11414.1 Shikimate dehydrogenase [Rhizopus microsporus ATCC 52813]